MKVPFDGNVNARLVEKRFNGTVFYYVYDQQGGRGYTIGYGFLNLGSDMKYPSIRYFDKENKLSGFSQGCSWSMIFKTHDEAKRKLREVESLYSNGFSPRPYLRLKMLAEIKPELIEISNLLTKLLYGIKVFNGVYFCDVSASGIQVMSCGCSSTLKYDISNKLKVISDYIDFVSNYGK